MQAPWPMIERVIIRALNDGLPSGRAGWNLPEAVEKEPGGFVRIARGPGSDDGTTDEPLIDVEAFHPKREKAWELAEESRQIMLALGATSAAGHLIDTSSTATSPNWVYYGPNVERYVASYRVGYRR